MPISGQTPISNISTVKEQEESYQPLLLAELTFADGGVLRLSSENLDSGNSGVQWSGENWFPRLKQQSLDQISSISNNGIVQSPTVTLEISDADKEILTAWEWANDRGFKGATLRLYFVYADLIAGTFSSDSRVVFVGLSNAPQLNPTSLSITADNMLNMSKRFFPTAQCAKNCIWEFPTTVDERADGLTNQFSPFYQCGYSPDQSGGVGNMNPATGQPFTYCNKDWIGCVARLGNSALPSYKAAVVQIEQDTSGRTTGRFGGSRFIPPYDWRGKRYISDTKEQGINNPNDGRIGKYYPMVYGTARIDALPMASIGDPNTTRCEVVVALGKIHTDLSTQGPIQAVIVNDQLVPFYSSGSDSNFAWYWINNGDRNGVCNRFPLYDSGGDPYGSLAVILVVVPYDVIDSSSTPNVKVVMSGSKIRAYHSDSLTDFTVINTANPLWHLFDMLTWMNYTPAQLDIGSFVSWASYVDTSVNYTQLNGINSSHFRFRAGIGYTNVRSATEVLTNFLAGFRGMLRNGADGRLQVLIKTTLADQQPAPVSGSNYNTPLSSVTAAGAVTNGYVAYDFNESNIKLTSSGTVKVPSLTFSQRASNDTPNRISVSFQDEEASYVDDSLTLADPDDVARMGGQLIRATVSPEGIVNFDQATRILQGVFSENYRGNPRNSTVWFDGLDSGGTLIATFTTTSKAIDLKCGHIIRLSHALYSISGQLFRVTGIKPSADAEEFTITANWHKDEWYLDSAGQASSSTGGTSSDPGYTPPPTSSTIGRSIFAWAPLQTSPPSGDPLFTRPNFQVLPTYATVNGVTGANYAITGHLPVNTESALSNPVVSTVAGATGSGSVPAGTYFVVLSAIDSGGLESSVSSVTNSAVLTGSGHITLSGIAFPTGTSSYKLFAGTDPAQLTLQASASGTPTSITMSSYSVTGESAPDELFSYLDFIATPIIHAGVWTDVITAATNTTITITGAGWTTNQWVGRVVSILGKGTPGVAVPYGDFTVTSNTATVLTMSGGGLTALGVTAGDIVTLRTKPSSFSASTIGDSGFANSLARLGTPVPLANIAPTTPVAVQTQTPHGLSTGDTALLSKTSVADGSYTVTVVDAFTYTLNSTTGSSFSGYYGGGIMQPSGSGLTANAEAGNLVRIIAGTGAGQVATIASNTSTVLTIAGTWTQTPNASSVFIITDGSQLGSTNSALLSNSDPTATGTVNFALAGGIGSTVLFQGYTATSGGSLSRDAITPLREIYVPTPVLNAYATIQGVQQQTYVFSADTGAANAYVITLSPAPAIVSGSKIVFPVAHANTGASTVSVNGTSYSLVKKVGSSVSTALASGDLVVGQMVEADYDGTNFQVITLGGGGGGAGTVTHTTGALTVDMPVFGNGTDDIKVGTKSGTTNKVATVSGTLTAGNFLTTSSGDLVDAGFGTPVPVNKGGSGTTTPALVAGSNVTITGSWPNQTIAASGGSSPVTETPAGTLNGSNASFTLSFTPIAGSLVLYLNGVEQILAVDYALSGTSISYSVAPKSTDLHIVQYTH